MEKQYRFDNRIYTVTNCTKDDIPFHTERVLSYWTSCNVDIEAQISALNQSVDESTAFKVLNDSGETEATIYCIRNGKYYQSNMLWFNNKRMFAILCYYMRLTANILIIKFKPHSKDFIPFEFIVQDSSIRLFHSDDLPLEINLYSTKSDRLYELHFKKFNIEEL